MAADPSPVRDDLSDQVSPRDPIPGKLYRPVSSYRLLFYNSLDSQELPLLVESGTVVVMALELLEHQNVMKEKHLMLKCLLDERVFFLFLVLDDGTALAKLEPVEEANCA